MSYMLTRFAMSGASPTAPLNVKPPVELRGNVGDQEPQVLAATPSVVAGSPGRRLLSDGYNVLKVEGNSVPGWPFAMSASPAKGPNANMKVCVPSAIIE